jgi:DNA-directed RNA polymerase specialized sigma24 family protein
MASMSPEGSITGLIHGMKLGDEVAAGRIWQRYSPRLAALARQRLPAWLRSVVDEDDVANSVMQDVIVGSRAGRFPNVQDRDDLWRLLACFTVRKAIHQVKRAKCQKRPPPWKAGPLEESLVATECSPDLQVIAAEEFDHLLELLRVKDEGLITIALWKFEGYTNTEIARRIGCTLNRVARKLELIRMIWEAEGPS